MSMAAAKLRHLATRPWMMAVGSIAIGSAAYLGDVGDFRSTVDYVKNVAVQRFNQIESWGTLESWKLCRKFSPLPPPPWLPTHEELGIPSNVPTLVINLEKVLMKMEFNRTTGWVYKKRPGAERFLNELSRLYDVIIFCDSEYYLAQELFEFWKVPICGLLGVEFCVPTRAGGYIKDTTRLGRDMTRVLVIDHDLENISFNRKNAIHVKPFEGKEDDDELDNLWPLLKTIGYNVFRGDEVPDQLLTYGGGDCNIGRRFMESYNDKMNNFEKRRKLFGFTGNNKSIPKL